MPIGELHATFIFATAKQAKALWNVMAFDSESYRILSINRWSTDADHPDGRLITLLTENEHQEAFERARELMSSGEEIQTPDFALNIFAAKRQAALDMGGGRFIQRYRPGLRLVE